MQNRRDFMKAGAATAAAAVVPSSFAAAGPQAPASAAASRPNIILILADDMGFSDIGCFGSEIPTPNLDKLANRGIRVNQFYNNPRCCPSRASIMTGLYAQQAHMGMMVSDHGRYPFPQYAGDLSAQSLTIAEGLKSAGYNTAMVGKWHLTPEEPSVGKHNWPLQRGFDKFWGMISGASVYFSSPHLVQDNERLPSPDPSVYLTDLWAEHASGYVKELAKDKKPFFLYCAFNAPHWPIQAPEELIAKHSKRYAAGWDTLREERHRKQIATGIVSEAWPLSPRDPRVPAWENAEAKDWEMRRMAVYAAMIERLDTGIGSILDQLEASGAVDNTLIIFMSDNGGNAEELGRPRPDHPAAIPVTDSSAHKSISDLSKPCEVRMPCAGNVPGVMPGSSQTFQSIGIPWGNCANTPFRLYKHYTQEGGISTPFIASWPKVIKPQARPVNAVGHETDLMPTFLEVAGATYPASVAAGPIPPLVGESLMPVFHGLPRSRGPIFWEHEGNKAVRDGKWKLVSRFPESWELYDMEADRTEMHDLAATETTRTKSMAAMYDAWATRIGVQPWPMPQTPKNEATGDMPTPPYLTKQ